MRCGRIPDRDTAALPEASSATPYSLGRNVHYWYLGAIFGGADRGSRRWGDRRTRRGKPGQATIELVFPRHAECLVVRHRSETRSHGRSAISRLNAEHPNTEVTSQGRFARGQLCFRGGEPMVLGPNRSAAANQPAREKVEYGQ